METTQFTSVSTAIIQAAIMFGIAAVMSLFVAVLIKVLFTVVRRFSGDKKS